jgi:hypothetical protein
VGRLAAVLFKDIANGMLVHEPRHVQYHGMALRVQSAVRVAYLPCRAEGHARVFEDRFLGLAQQPVWAAAYDPARDPANDPLPTTWRSTKVAPPPSGLRLALIMPSRMISKATSYLPRKIPQFGPTNYGATT